MPYHRHMQLQLFDNLPEFIDSWQRGLSSLDEKSRNLLVSVLLNGQSRHQMAASYGVSRQSVAQMTDRAIKRMRIPSTATDSSLIADAIAKATHIIDAAGLELAYKLRSHPNTLSRTVIQQLVNISAISPEQEPWAHALLCITPAPDRKRPSLDGLHIDARQIAGHHLRGIPPRHLTRHLTDWREAIAAWPNFDLRLHLAAVTGNHPNPRSGRYHPIKGWSIPIYGDPLLTKHYIARALDRAQRPLTVPDIVQAANELAQADGVDRTYSTQQINSVIHVHKGFKWAGPATYGLKSWDVGHSPNITTSDERINIGLEIVHLIKHCPGPITYDDIENHILERFNVNADSVYAALTAQHSRKRFIIHPDRTVSLNLQDVEPPSI